MEAYLDNSATTPLCRTAKEKMLYAMENCWGNPSSLHQKGIDAHLLLCKARKEVAKALCCDEKEIFFTSGGTEGNNIAIMGTAYSNMRKGKRLVTTKIEHPSVLNTFRKLESEGFEVIYIGTDESGHIDMNEFENAVDEKTILVSMMVVNNEVGTIQPFEKIRQVVRMKNSPAIVHVDAVQAFGKMPLNPKKAGIDLMTVSSHKIHGPKGAGALFVKQGTRIKGVTFGGGQENDIRPGTEAMPAIAGFWGAVSEMNVKKNLERITLLRNSFTDKLRKIEGVKINSPEDALPFIVNISLEGLRSETVLNFLSDMEIYISSGSACAKGHKSYVLGAMGLDDRRIDSSLRVSLSAMTTEQELDYFIEGIISAMKVIMKR